MFQTSMTHVRPVITTMTKDHVRPHQVFYGAPKASSNSDTDTSNSTILSGTAKPSQSSVVPQLGSRAEALDVTSWTWKNLAESVLCSDGSAAKIRDALHTMLPSNHFFVLITKPGWGYSSWWLADGEYLQDRSKCGHDMWVWKSSSPISSACSTTEVRWANYIINEAVRLHSHPEDIRKAIISQGMAMKLNAHFVATWDPSGFQSWAALDFPSCFVYNNKALVYLKP